MFQKRFGKKAVTQKLTILNLLNLAISVCQNTEFTEIKTHYFMISN